LIQVGRGRCIVREIAHRDLMKKASKSWQQESRGREVRHSDSDVSRVGHRSECKTGGGDRRSRELGTHKLKVYRLEGSSHEA
jgi:hypothetical protein